jgi:hypothetical protein
MNIDRSSHDADEQEAWCRHRLPWKTDPAQGPVTVVMNQLSNLTVAEKL